MAFLGIVAVSYAFFYVLSSMEQQGASSFAVVNIVGLFAVVLGIAAAVIILRRAAPTYRETLKNAETALANRAWIPSSLPSLSSLC